MKRWMAWVTVAGLMLGLLAGLSGCNVMSEEDKETVENVSSTGEGVVDSTVIAEVDGAQITFAQFKYLYDKYAEQYTYYGYNLEIDWQMRTYIQDILINALFKEKLIELKADERGYYDLDAQNEAAMSDSVAERFESMELYFITKAEDALAQDPSLDRHVVFDQLVAQESKATTGSEMTLQDYCVWMEKQMRIEKAIEQLKVDELKNVSVTEDAISEWYTTTLEREQAQYQQNPEMYKENADAFESTESLKPVTYVPEGYSRILHIFTYPYGRVSLIEPEYESLTARVEKIVQEWGALMLEDIRNGNQANAERIAQLQEEYITKKNRIAAADEKNNADAKAAVEAAYAKLQSGEDFRAVLKEYTRDNYFMDNERMVQNGMLISPAYQSVTASEWSNTVKQEFEKLEIGEYSPIFQDEDGFHIVYYVSDESATGAKPLESVRADINAMLLVDQEYYAWESVKEDWVKAADTKLYEENYRWYGRSGSMLDLTETLPPVE